MSRDKKFHHRERLKVNRRFYFGRDLRCNAKWLGQVVNTPKPCSCLMCGNRRNHSGQTLQERRAEINEQENQSVEE